eukprot:PhF_6_TR5221/c0_g1_i1/m.7534/K03347/CUL1, CDC53; cullin 1
MAKAPAAAAKPNAEFEQRWNQLSGALNDVCDLVLLRKQATGAAIKDCKTQMEWYNVVYGMCTQGSGQLNQHSIVHERLRKWLEDNLHSKVTVQLQMLKTDHKVLSAVSTAYSDYKIIRKWSKIVFQYIDQHYTAKKNTDSIDKLMLKAFHEAVYKKVSLQLRGLILEHVQRYRNQEDVSLTILGNVIKFITEVGGSVAAKQEDALRPYLDDIEKPLLDATRDFYKSRAAQEFHKPGGHYTYIEWAEVRIKLEEALGRELEKESYPRLIKSIDDEILANFHLKIVNHDDSGCYTLLDEEKYPEAGRMYRMMCRLPNGLDPMAEAVRKFCVFKGKEINSLFEGGGEVGTFKGYITECLNLHDKFTGMFENQFGNAKEFHKALKKGFEEFFNKKLTQLTQTATGEDQSREFTQPDLLCTYLDALMKRDADLGVGTAEDEAKIVEKCTTLFTYIQDKDVFQEYYKTTLAKRLLQTNPNEDLERSMLEKLQREMGKSYTHHLEGMLKDRDVGKDLQQKFVEYVASKDIQLPCEFGTQVLTTGHWPPFKADKITMPDTLKQCVVIFDRFYKAASTAHQTRVLSWVHALGTASLSAKFTSGVKDVSVTVFQACVLLLVERAPNGRVQVKEMAAQLGLPETSKIKPAIASLHLNKTYAILSKVTETGEPATTKGVQDTDFFTYNDAYQNKVRKFKVPMPSTNEQRATPQENANANRRFVIDACIVRVMKSRRELRYQILVNEVVDQLSRMFKPEPKVIKQRIEDLITRGYLERDSSDPTLFRYLTH